MATAALYADVVLPLPIGKFFTYSLPSSIRAKAGAGQRVVVPFGKRKFYTGLIWQVHNHKPEGYELRDIHALLDEEPLVHSLQREFWKWLSDYYMCSLGEVFKAALPSGLKLESESRILAVPGFSAEELPDEECRKLWQEISNQKYLSFREAERLLPGSQRFRIINRLVSAGAVRIEEHLREKYRPLTEPFLVLGPEWQQEEKLCSLLNRLERAPAQSSTLLEYLRISGFRGKGKPLPVAKKSLLKQRQVSEASLMALRKKGVLELREFEKSRVDWWEAARKEPALLTEPQRQAMQRIKESWTRQDVVLLHGVTSSGKTEIYIHLIEEQLREGKQVLYLLPEIALTGQIITRLRRVFGNRVGIYHSRFSDAERVETYQSVRKHNGFPLVLGVRSSVFLPFQNLGLVIVDEEHENTYKQFDPAPRYHARDTAIYLAGLHGAKILLGTATPSLESWYNATTGKYGMVELPERYTEIRMPEIVLVNTREAYRKKQMKSHFSPVLLKEMERVLDNGEQIILFQNRRGFSPYLECQMCGHVPRCKHCDVSLTYHQKIGRLICHYCGYSIPVPKTCPACSQAALQTRGFGTEKVEDEIAAFFPKARIARLDLDATRSRRNYERILEDFEQQKIDILVGTQMISKGLDFDHVKLVGILHADNMLNFPDFRAFERSYQLMTQVSGRAGRKDTPGKVVLQTAQPGHPVITDLLNQDHRHFYHSQLEERKQFRYPPFSRLIRFTLKHKDPDLLKRAARELVSSLEKKFPGRVMGPEAPLVSRIQNLYLQQVLLKLEKDHTLAASKRLAEQSVSRLTEMRQYRLLQVHPDVDPH
ncbi:MAG TPA: primosomal protein N' [Bacteroidetes bacterium]|nr:primosomal protein N' [Bacteroidota bacterium]